MNHWLRNVSLISAVMLTSLSSGVAAEPSQGFSANMNYTANRPPLVTKAYIELPLGAIRPTGWLDDQLHRMAQGMTGHLDSLYSQVMGPRNGWLGGDGDVWERGPYWIDGLLPLAYILDDEGLKEKVQPWIEWSLQSQQEDGYFGPSEDRPYEVGLQRDNARDWWPKMVMLKVMQQYYMATGDERVIPFLTRYFRYQLENLPNQPLGHWTYWGQQRGGDNLMVVLWLYNLTGDEFLLELADLIHRQTFDWTGAFLSGDYVLRPLSLHCVNLAQGFKEPVIYYQRNHDEANLRAVRKAASDIRRVIGFPTGLWAGDELLRIGNPTQGSELCTAVEMMFSLEKILEITGDVEWADYLERVAYNALPTQVTDNYDARQYYQQINQVLISRQDRNFITAYNGTDQLMGILAGYPCCTSNLHQGWPKFTQHLWFATEDNGVAAMVYAPSTVTMRVADGVEICIDEKTNYPFEETIRFDVRYPDRKVKSAVFPFHLRIPAWCQGAEIVVNGERMDTPAAGSVVKLSRRWENGDCIELRLPMQVATSYWYEGAVSVERGPLLYALRIGEEWRRVEDDGKFGTRYGTWYYEVYPKDKWNYCLVEDHLKPENLQQKFTVHYREVPEGSYPWNLENAPIEIHAVGREFPNWTLYNGSAGPIPYSVQYQVETGPDEPIVLVPYGCTTLRIAEFPITR